MATQDELDLKTKKPDKEIKKTKGAKKLQESRKPDSRKGMYLIAALLAVPVIIVAIVLLTNSTGTKKDLTKTTTKAKRYIASKYAEIRGHKQALRPKVVYKTKTRIA